MGCIYELGIQITNMTLVKGQGQINLKYVKNCCTAGNANSSFIFWSRMFIFGKLVAYGVKISIGYSVR